MPELPDFAAKGQDLAAKAYDKAVDAVRDTVRDTVDTVRDTVDTVRTNPTVEKVLDMVPTPGEVRDQVTATANELIGLSQDVQNKVLTALKWNV